VALWDLVLDPKHPLVGDSLGGEQAFGHLILLPWSKLWHGDWYWQRGTL